MDREQALEEIALWWHMHEIQAELVDHLLPDETVVLQFMGSGGSHQVTAGTVRIAFPRKTQEPQT